MDTCCGRPNLILFMAMSLPAVFMLRITVLLDITAVYMLVPALFPAAAAMCVFMPVKKRHVMVVIFMLRVQNHGEIAGIQPRLFHPCNLIAESLHRQAV